MTDVIIGEPQSSLEIRQRDFDFSAKMATGESVSSATATHVPPSGAAVVCTVGAAVSGVVPVTLSLVGTAAIGAHTLIVVATTSTGEKIDLRCRFDVPY